MEKTLIRIEVLVMVITACVVIQTVWWVGEKVLSPAAAIAARIVTDVNIAQVGGQSVKSPYAPPIKVTK
jgi:hypothetical protein